MVHFDMPSPFTSLSLGYITSLLLLRQGIEEGSKHDKCGRHNTSSRKDRIMNRINNEDFFIYVPTANDVETLAHQNTPQCGGPVAKGSNEMVNAALKDWVKISLAGPFVVYPRLQDTHEDT